MNFFISLMNFFLQSVKFLESVRILFSNSFSEISKKNLKSQSPTVDRIYHYQSTTTVEQERQGSAHRTRARRLVVGPAHVAKRTGAGFLCGRIRRQRGALDHESTTRQLRPCSNEPFCHESSNSNFQPILLKKNFGPFMFF